MRDAMVFKRFRRKRIERKLHWQILKRDTFEWYWPDSRMSTELRISRLLERWYRLL